MISLYHILTPFVFYLQRNKASTKELAKGQKVICKHKNGRYYHSEVDELTTATFYEVVFDDGSYSNNLFPEDIVVSYCPTLYILIDILKITVLWHECAEYKKE